MALAYPQTRIADLRQWLARMEAHGRAAARQRASRGRSSGVRAAVTSSRLRSRGSASTITESFIARRGKTVMCCPPWKRD